MLPPPIPSFPHRLNAHGFHESICRTCHLTVAAAKHEAELEQYERDHLCNPVRLYQLTEDRRHPQQCWPNN